MSTTVEKISNSVQTVETLSQPAIAEQQEKTDKRLYRVIWRWHFYAGLIVLPVLLIASITGGIYIFIEELEPLMYPYRTVTVQEKTVPYQQQVEAAKAVVPEGFEAHGLTISQDPTRASVVFFHQEPDRYLYVFVNQHTGAVQGQYEYGDSFFDIVLKIHRTMFAGKIGRYIVELSTSWGIILVITGVYLWWPRGRKKLMGVWLPQIKGKSYVIWRDWHTVPGFYFSLLAFLVMFTGLFFTEFFGGGYRITSYVTNSYPPSYINPPNSKVIEGAKPLTVDDIIAVARREQNQKQLYVDFPHTLENSYSILAGTTDNLSTYSNLHIDQYSGAVIDRITLKDLTVLVKVALLAYPIHVGSIYGMPTKILALLVCLLIVAMSVTGAVMWWVRRPRGKTGFPQKPQLKPAKWLILTICLLGLLMPTVGASLIVIIVGDFFINRWRNRKSLSAANS